MKNNAPIFRAVKCVIAALVFAWCADCGRRDEAAAQAGNSANASAKERDWVQVYLSENPLAVKNKDWMQIDAGDHAADPDAILLYLYSALKRNPKVNRCRAFWRSAIFGHSIGGIATYDRKTKTLYCRKYNTGGYDDFVDYSGDSSVLTGVMMEMLLHSAEKSAESGESTALDDLAKNGCGRVDRSYSKRVRLKPQK